MKLVLESALAIELQPFTYHDEPLVEQSVTVVTKALGVAFVDEYRSDIADGATGIVATMTDTEKVIGTAIFSKNRDDEQTADLHTIAVLKKYQRQKVGSRLLANVESLAWEQGCSSLALYALSGALKFYQSMPEYWPASLGSSQDLVKHLAGCSAVTQPVSQVGSPKQTKVA